MQTTKIGNVADTTLAYEAGFRSFDKVKSINAENMQAFRKQRRAYSVIIAVVIVFAFAFRNVF